MNLYYLIVMAVKFIIVFAIAYIVLFAYHRFHKADMASSAIRFSIMVVLVSGLICDTTIAISDKFKETKVEETSSIESLYAIKDYSETTESISGNFLYIHGESDTYLSVRYVSGDNENGYSIKSLNVESDNVKFIESDEDPQLEVIERTSFYRYNPPWYIKQFSFITGITNCFDWENLKNSTETIYKFTVPKGTIVYEYNIDLE